MSSHEWDSTAKGREKNEEVMNGLKQKMREWWEAVLGQGLWARGSSLKHEQQAAFQ